jgi:FHS family glucose/mannose:H+ symporter-like MFS transporter
MDSASVSSPRTYSPPINHARFEWFLLHAGFVVIGIITASLGPLIPVYTRTWGITDAQAGFFFPAQYFTSLFGVIATSWLLPRFGPEKVLGAGFLFLTLGMGFLGISPWFLTATCVAVNGFGYGLANPTTNLRGTQLPSKNVAAAVSLLNFSWGVGAVACPFLVGALVPWIGIRGFGICVAVFTLAICGMHFFRHVPVPDMPLETPKHSLADWKKKMKVTQAVPLAFLFFLYVGTEASFGGWVGALEKRLPTGGHLSALAIAPSVFYGFLLLGRGVAPLALRRYTTLTISIAGTAMSCVGGSAIALAQTKVVLLSGVAAAGLGCAALFPIFVTWLADIYHEDANWVGALYFSASALGGSFLPQLVGIIATKSHSLRVGILVPLAASLGMIFLSLRARPEQA